ncbi:unnamed protein product [Dicrocoelium dendriticum]|nr:unnamed protein product [Dicrocoelium dendriticum]
MNKRDELCCFVASERPDVVGLAETWLHAELYTQELELNGYSCFRCDRLKNAHGGVLLYIRSSLRGRLVSTYRSDDGLCELLWCSIRLRRGELLVGAVYRSPLSRCLDWLPHLRTHMSRPHFLLMGDFNCPRIRWPDVHLMPGHSEVEAKFVDLVLETGASQHICQPTRISTRSTSSCLDLMLTSYEQRVRDVRILEPLATSDHSVLIADMELSLPYSHPLQPAPNYWKTDFDGLARAASQLDWSLSQTASVEDCWIFIKERLTSLCSKFVPLKCRKVGPIKPHWFDKEYGNLARRRRRLWDKFLLSGSANDYEGYKCQRNLCNSAKKNKRRHFEEQLALAAKTAPKRIFAYVKRRLKPAGDVPVLDGTDGQPLTSSTERASALAAHFASVFANNQVSVPSSTCTAFTELDSLHCGVEEVAQLLANLDGTKPAGPDGLHPLVLKSLSTILSPIVTDLFNRSLSEGLLPVDWKCAVVKPIPKGGDPSKVDNYRPICLTPILAKVAEKIVKKRLLQLLQSNEVLTPAQHGFMQGRSCITNLLVTRHEWLKAINKGKSVDVIFIDFSKAFDKVSHEVLLHKLSMCGVGGSLHRWIRDFLVGRKWRVQVDDHLTDWYPSTSGVPQGTVLGPTLFLIHINDLPQRLRSPCALFADDMKIWREIDAPDDCGLLQQDLNRLSTWSAEVLLPVNPAKSVFMSLGKGADGRTYTLDGQTLYPTPSVKDLGVLSRYDLKSVDNTNSLYRNGLRMLWALKRSFCTWSEEVATRLFSSIIRPMLEYGSPAYFPITRGEAQKIERVQHVVTRLIPSLRGFGYEDRCEKLGLYTLSYRRVRVDLIMTYRILHLGEFPMLRPMLHLRGPCSTRGHRYKLVVPDMKRVPHPLCFERRVVNIWNSLPEHVIEATSVQQFKTLLDLHFASIRFRERLHTYDDISHL